MNPSGLLALTATVAVLAFVAGQWTAEPNDTVPTFESAANRDEDLRQILRLEQADERASALVRFLEGARPEDATHLRAVLVEDPNNIDELVEMLFASWWARSDPAAAFDQRIDPQWEKRHPWLRNVISEWTRHDPIAAASAVEGLPEDRRTAAVRALLDAWLETSQDPAPLFGLIQALEVKPRGRAVERFLAGMIEMHGMEATETFVEAQPDDSMDFGTSMKNELMGRMGVALARRDEGRARAWAAKHGEGNGRRGLGVLLHLAFHWGANDGPVAMEWAMGLEPSNERHATIARAFLSFQRVRRDEAAEWLRARQPTPELRQLYVPYLDHLIANQEPERAIEVALSAQDAETRNSLLKAAGKSWLRRDPEAADAWMQSADLSPEVTEEILRVKRAPRSSSTEG